MINLIVKNGIITLYAYVISVICYAILTFLGLRPFSAKDAKLVFEFLQKFDMKFYAISA